MSRLGETHFVGRACSRWTLGALIVLVAAGTAVWLAKPTIPDPAYRGKRLSEYVALLPDTLFTGGGHVRAWLGGPDLSLMTPLEKKERLEKIRNATHEATQAIEMLDSKSFPLLLDWLERRESAAEKAWEKARSKAFLSLRRLGIRKGGPLHCRTEHRRSQAVTALMDLHQSGCDFTRLVSHLTRLARDADPNVRQAARFLLSCVDHKAYAELEKQDNAGMTNGISGP